WKMNHGPRATRAFFEDLHGKRPRASGLTGIIFPPPISLQTAVEASRGTDIEIGAQNVHWEKNGAYTGEISGPMLLELGLKNALVGHSERRQYFGETDETVRKRTESLLEQGIRP